MLRVGEFLHHLSIHVPGQSLVKTSLQNFLSHNFSSDENFSAATLQTLLNECLEYPHWQQNKSSLEGELKNYIELVAKKANWTFRLEDVQWPTDCQVIAIESFKVWIDTINAYLNFVYKNGEQFRIVYDSLSQKALGLILHPNGSLMVQQFDRKFTIRFGSLVPLRDDLVVSYDGDLNLISGVVHKIEISTYMTTHFKKISDQNVVGAVIRGYIFQKFHELKNEPLLSYPRLFYTLKRVEQFFIKRESDPFYRGLIESLEENQKNLRWGDPEAVAACPDLLARAQNALDYVFTGDKLMTLLLRDLQNTLTQRGSVSAPKQPAPKQEVAKWIETVSVADTSKWKNADPSQSKDSVAPAFVTSQSKTNPPPPTTPQPKSSPHFHLQDLNFIGEELTRRPSDLTK